MKKHLVLVGLPGAGKTTVGRLVAQGLDAPFQDLDQDIERRAGRPVSAIFALRGEAGFRELERLEMTRALAAPPHVIAPGGGWAAEPGNLEAATPRAFILYLRASPRVAATRIAGTAVRPLLAGDPEERLTALFEAREPSYRRADRVVETVGRGVGEVAEEVIKLARSHGGW